MEGLAAIQAKINRKQEQDARERKIKRRFERLERLGLVRLDVEPDFEPYDDSYVDTWDDLSEEEKEQIKADIREKIERDGVWGVCGVCMLHEGDEFQADSCWGFIGDDWKGSGYDIDIMSQTIDALRKAIRARCKVCKGKDDPAHYHVEYR